MTDAVSTHAVECIAAAAREAANDIRNEACRPSMMLRPSIQIDGNQWCALYGENLQDGVAGFGDSPAEAFAAFDRAWFEKLPAPPPDADGRRTT